MVSCQAERVAAGTLISKIFLNDGSHPFLDRKVTCALKIRSWADTVIKKGEIYEGHLFTAKDERFKGGFFFGG